MHFDRKRNRALRDIYRIQEWIHFLGFPILGYLFTAQEVNLLEMLLPVVCTFLIGSYAFSLNEICEEGFGGKRLFYPLISLLFTVPFFFIFSSYRTVILSICIILSLIYSSPFPELKSKPILCTLCNAAGDPLLFLLGCSKIDDTVILFYFMLFFLISSAQLIHEQAHKSEDVEKRYVTTAIYLGVKKVKISIVLCMVASCVLATLINRGLAFWIFLSGVSIFYLIFIKKIKFQTLRKIFKWEAIFIGVYMFWWLIKDFFNLRV